MSSLNQQTSITPMAAFKVRPIGFDDIKAAFRAGIQDFTRRPALSIFFGLVYAAFGIVLTFGLFIYDQIWLVIPAAVGFPLIAPFVAAGLYEMSRRFTTNESFTARDIFTVIFKQQRREFGWMAFVVLFVFWVWIYQARLLLALFLQWQSFSSLEKFVEIITTTSNGLMFLGVGSIVGAFMATALFSVTVIAMPLLLHKEIDFVSAMLISIKTVKTSPIVMLCWGAFIAALVLIAILPAFAGVIFILPILGHATSRLYEKAIEAPPMTPA